MTGEKHDFELPAGSGGARRKALYRAGLAGALMVVLVIGLLMAGGDEVPQAQSVSGGAMAPIEAPVLEAAVMPAAAVTSAGSVVHVAAPDEGNGPGRAVAAEPGATLQPEPSQPPETAQLSSIADSAVVAETAPAAPTPVRKPSTPPGPGYMLQLGVFGDPSNADSLRDELDGVGFPAHVQSRVVIGPYPDRKAAQAAHDKLRRERKLEGLIIPPRKP